MNSEDTISKTQAVLDLLLKHDQEKPKCKHSMHQILREAFDDNKKEVGSSFADQKPTDTYIRQEV